MTAAEVLQRVRGCGKPEAEAILARLGADDKAIVDAYAEGAAAVESVLDALSDTAQTIGHQE